MSGFDNKPVPQPKRQDIDEVRTQVLNMEVNDAGLVCYMPVCLINVIGSLLFLFTEPADNRFLRFHALQSLALTIVFAICATIVNILAGVLAAIPFLNWLAFVPWLMWIAITVGYVWKSVEMGLYARKGGIEKLPIIGDIADRMA